MTIEQAADKVRKLRAHSDSAARIGNQAEAQAFREAAERLEREYGVQARPRPVTSNLHASWPTVDAERMEAGLRQMAEAMASQAFAAAFAEAMAQRRRRRPTWRERARRLVRALVP